MPAPPLESLPAMVNAVFIRKILLFPLSIAQSGGICKENRSALFSAGEKRDKIRQKRNWERIQ
jgi:hypothetical protein